MLIGDSREILRVLPEDSVHLIHTSPPYNIEKNYAHTDDNLEHEAYLSLLENVFKECFRVLTPGSSLFFQTGYSQNGGDEVFPIDMLTYRMFRSLGFRLWDRIIWHYRGGMSFTRKFKNTHETILWWVKPAENGSIQPFFDVDAVRERSRSYDKRNNLYGKNPGNVWSADRVAFGGKARDTSHIAIYPEVITERIIRSCSLPGQVVLDPFAGSGTTPAMARALNRRWVGIEISPTYAAEAYARIGRRQASEAGSVVSGLIKVLGFGNRPCTKGREYVVDALATWLRSVDMVAYRDLWSERLGPVFKGEIEGSSEVKKEKPLAWAFFDDFFRGPAHESPVVLVSAVLDAAFPQRRRWNGVRKFKHALSLLQQVLEFAGEGVHGLVGAIAAAEPSSFECSGDDGSLTFLGPGLKLPSGRQGARASLGDESTESQGSLFDP